MEQLSEPQLTAEQEAILQFAANDTEHGIVKAGPGTGKTFTLIECLRATESAGPGRIGVAFNKSIAEEGGKKLASRRVTGATFVTYHSLGFRNLRRAAGKTTVDEGKYDSILLELQPNWWVRTKSGSIYPTREEAVGVRKLVDLCRLYLVGTDESVHRLARQNGIPTSQESRAAVIAALQRGTERLDTIDYADMLYLPLNLGLALEQHPVLIVDECQDLSVAARHLVLKSTDRLLAVGDPHQAINGFAGGDPQSMVRLRDAMADTGWGCRVLPLSVSWRLPASHVQLAQNMVRSLQARPGAPAGSILEDGGDYGHWRRHLVPGETLVLCRRNAPLVQAIYRLIADRIPAKVLGRDVGKGIQRLIDKLARQADSEDLSALVVALKGWYEATTAALLQDEASPEAVAAVQDQYLCAHTLLTGQFQHLSEVRDFLSQYFTDNKSAQGKVILSSIHKAKGLEAEVVLLLEAGSLPYDRVRHSRGEPSQASLWEQEQEHNLIFVACTRAKDTLVFCDGRPRLTTLPDRV